MGAGGTGRAAPKNFRLIGRAHGFAEYELVKNGLRVLVCRDTSVPVAGLMVTYRVGSRHEAVGHTGATHILEHLMFKGSKKFPKRGGVSVIDRLEERGAVMNATTWLDRTNYFEVVPEEHLVFAVELEADRMRNARITQDDLDEELPAVRSEYAMRVHNVPEDFLEEQVWATAFQAHPYHHPTIGWLADIENVPLSVLHSFYDTYYWPDNAVVSLISTLEEHDALALIGKHFGVHPRAPHRIPVPYTVEPEQSGRRFVEVVRSGEKNLVTVAWKSPRGLDADTPALIILMHILGGGPTSRLHRALVERRLATEAHTAYAPLVDPSLSGATIALVPEVAHEQVERIVWREVHKLIERGVPDAELARALAVVETELRSAQDGHLAKLSILNDAIALGDWRYFFDLPSAVRNVKPADLVRVARTYLTDRRATVGYYRTL